MPEGVRPRTPPFDVGRADWLAMLSSKDSQTDVTDPLGDVMDWIVNSDLGEESAEAAERVGGAVSPGSSYSSPSMRGGVEPMPLMQSRASQPRPAQTDWSGAQSPRSPAGDNPPQLRVTSRSAASYCGIAEKEEKKGLQLEPEEEEWDARQQQTGAAGRLVVYEAGDRPRNDLTLRGGGLRRIMVATVSDGGKAAQAGVKAGDVLVSVNGTKEFKGKSAEVVLASLQAPVMLVFMGFVGKLQAEVRLNHKPHTCGLSSQQQVLFSRQDAPVQVMDEVVFQSTGASIFLTTRSAASSPPQISGPTLTGCTLKQTTILSNGDTGCPASDEEDEEEDCIDIDSLTNALVAAKQQEQQQQQTGLETAAPQPEQPPEEVAAVYELRGHEARKLVARALSRTALKMDEYDARRRLAPLAS